MRFSVAPLTDRFLRSFEWHDWFAWHPIDNPDGYGYGDVIWLETVRRKRIAVGPQGLTGNYEWQYRLKSSNGDKQNP